MFQALCTPEPAIGTNVHKVIFFFISYSASLKSVSFGNNSNIRRRKAEDKLAITFVAIVTGFLVTNFPRIFLNFHEILVFENMMACTKAGKR